MRGAHPAHSTKTSSTKRTEILQLKPSAVGSQLLFHTAMAAPTTLLSRVSTAARLRSLSGIRNKSSIPRTISPSQTSDSGRKFSRIFRLPTALRCLGSMMPLHSAIASARLTSILSAESQSWGLVPQGLSMPL